MITPIKIPKGIFLDPNKMILKFIWWSKCLQEPRKNCTRRKIRGKLPQFKQYRIGIAISIQIY